jgi:hypothetical protein
VWCERERDYRMKGMYILREVLLSETLIPLYVKGMTGVQYWYVLRVTGPITVASNVFNTFFIPDPVLPTYVPG